MHRAYTVRIADAAEPARLASEWRANASGPLCMDTGFDVARRHADGTIDHQTFSCAPQTGPIAAFAARMFAIARAAPGNSTREGPGGQGSWG